MDFARLFVLFFAVVCVSSAQKQNQNRLRAQERPVNQQYRYGSRLGNLGSGLPHQRNSLYKQPYRRGYDRARFQSGSRYNSINGRALGYGNYLRQMGRGYAQSRPALQNPLYRAGFSSSYKTGYPLPAPYPGYSPNYAPLPAQAPSLYGYDNYQVDRWGAWSSWSACSRSCDGGVQERTRKCKTSKMAMTLSLYKGQGHQHGNCPGFGKEFQPCNTSPCVSVKSYEDQKYEARKNQCSKFDKKDYLGQRYTWMPYIRDGLNECRLYCMAKGFRMFVELAKSVVDGTICGKLGASACYNGTCSRKRPNVEIKAAKSEDNAPFTKPVVDALVKPSNEKTPFQLAQNRNFLTLGGRNALQSYRSAAVDYHKKRPGPQQKQLYQRYNKNISPGLNIKPQVKSNRLVTRKVSGMFNSKAGLKLGYNEIFKIPTGATHIRIQEARPSDNYLALKVGDKYLVNGRWSIVLKKDIRAAGTLIKYRLNRGPKSTEVITAAGPTSKELKIVLLYQEGPPEIFFNYTIKLPKSRSNQVPKTATSLRRNNDNRARTKPTLHWSVAGWTKCSQRCGGGEQQLNIKCVAVYPGRKTTVVKSSYCHSLKKPNQRRRMCNMLPCKPSWKLLPWQPCNKKCGYGGFQQRDVRCIRVILTRQGKVEINAPFYTCGRRPAIRKDCPYVPCYAWKSDPWSACSRTCDKGTQSRRIFCVTNDKIRDDSHCDLRKKPDSFQMCNLRPCKANWFIGKWNKCAKYCGEGRQTRLVFCAGKDGASLPELYCKHQKQPSQSRVCINEKCNGIWLASNWTQCSTSCGVGERSRIVLCFGMHNGSMRQISEYLCDYHTKPNPKEICNLAKCQPEWYTTEWGQCSATCGRGIKTRQINCMMKDGKQGRGCQIETRPNAAMICKTKPCENEVDNRQVVESSFVKVATKSSEGKREAVTTQTLINKIFTTQLSKEGIVGHLKTTKQPKFAKASAPASKNILKVFSKNQVNKLSRSENQEEYSSSKTENKNDKIPTTKPLVLTTKPKKKIVKAICKNTHKQAYCAVILRIGFCKFTTYRNRCCTSCTGKSR